MMIETLRHARKVVEQIKYELHGETARANLELSLLRKPMERTQAMFFQVLVQAERDKDKT